TSEASASLERISTSSSVDCRVSRGAVKRHRRGWPRAVQSWSTTVSEESIDAVRLAGAVEYRILGPLEISTEEGTVAVATGRERTLLLLLLLHRQHPVSVDSIVEALWPDEPPSI